MINKRKLNE